MPYYHQLKELLREEIVSGRWPAGVQIPSEPELCRVLDVSRTVVRQALGDLGNEGLLRRRKGLGTFVAEPKIHGRLVQSLTGFHDDMLAQGRVPRTRVLDQRVVPAPKVVASELGLPEGTPVVMIDRVRSVDDEPIVLVTTYLPARPGAGARGGRPDRRARSTRRWPPRTASSSSAADACSSRSPRRPPAPHELDLEPGDPVLFLRSVTYTADEQAIEYYEARHRGDRTILEVDLVRKPPT